MEADESGVKPQKEIDGSQTISAEPIPLPGRPGAGTIIGLYQLLQLIGEGGMGEVWLAEQKQPVQRRVAIKLIKAGMNSRGRFDEEAVEQALRAQSVYGARGKQEARPGATPRSRAQGRISGKAGHCARARGPQHKSGLSGRDSVEHHGRDCVPEGQKGRRIRREVAGPLCRESMNCLPGTAGIYHRGISSASHWRITASVTALRACEPRSCSSAVRLPLRRSATI